MKGLFSVPGDYIYFKSQVPLHRISIGSKQWRYYDFGAKNVPPLICLPGVAGTADVFYKQIMSLSNKGFRVISVDIPRAWNHQEWIQEFEKFLDAIDVHHVETLSKDDLASRLSLTVDSASVGPLRLSDSFITIMDTNDYCAIPQELKDQVIERYPGARQAYLKTGGDFPFLSRPDEVNLHLQLHMRRVGVEGQPELVQGICKNGAGENSSDQNNEQEGAEDEAEDERKDYSGSTNENSGTTNENESPLAVGSPHSGSFENQIFSNVHLSNDQ